jgi:hypothetical protein
MEEQILWPVLIVGLLVGTFGWMIYWAGINVIGVFVGAGAGLAFAVLVEHYFELERFSLIIHILGMILGGVGGMYLMRALNYYAFFVIGVFLGTAVGSSFLALSIFEAQPWAQTDRALIVATVIGAVTGGLIVLMLRRYVIAIVAAVAAAMLIAVSFPGPHRDVIVLLVFIGSAAIQFLFIRMFLPEERMNLLAVERKSARS